MNRTTEYEQILTVILDDLRVCLAYTPNRENDLLCFMEQYLKGNGNDRPRILEQLRACMDGEEYHNPYLAYQHYGIEEIKQLEQHLRGYEEDMKTSEDKELVLRNLIIAINEMQEKCLGQLLDNWRRDHLTQFLVLVAKECSCDTALAVIDRENRW
ncbi:hypothetical protein [Anaerotignum sp.]|uniref:hypothetical protein n=1 Tax=Anaerotignum sp. TaxID=2039241 RepID=UPI0028A68415|nr:hypothetical protein [Anaerotignum sp.]